MLFLRLWIRIPQQYITYQNPIEKKEKEGALSCEVFWKFEKERFSASTRYFQGWSFDNYTWEDSGSFRCYSKGPIPTIWFRFKNGLLLKRWKDLRQDRRRCGGHHLFVLAVYWNVTRVRVSKESDKSFWVWSARMKSSLFLNSLAVGVEHLIPPLQILCSSLLQSRLKLSTTIPRKAWEEGFLKKDSWR